jgi:hypothetical protein
MGEVCFTHGTDEKYCKYIVKKTSRETKVSLRGKHWFEISANSGKEGV